MTKIRNAFRYLYDLPDRVGRPLSRSYIPELDGLRFLALFFVLVWHASIRAMRDYGNVAGPQGGDGYYWFFPHGEVGVILFFFISGFVVSQPFLSRPAQEWKVKSFYARRFIRIYPPYLIALSLCFVALKIVGYVPADAKSFSAPGMSLTSSYLASAFYLHSAVFNSASRLDPPMWSLELEVAFYTLAPLLLLVYTRIASKTARLACLGALVAALLLATVYAASQFSVDGRYRWGLLCHGYLFLLGIGAADIVGDRLSRERRTRWLFDAMFAAGLALVVGIGLYLSHIDARLSGAGATAALLVLTVSALAMVFVGAFYGALSSRFLRLPWIRLIGTMCYSVYLTHIVTMQACGEVLDRLQRLHNATVIWAMYLGILIPVALAAGLVFYLCIERPFATLATYGGRRSGAHVAPVSASAATSATSNLQGS
ncbi:acyltransferase family protein [Paraburkholderia bannensis]|uniref:acyltransferase family protein n=1 Tax=Paraburkholderia bannensis TaxID=765414 RepID=UPI002AC34298|nr:acyltransferase [Paraburkholderia bannensis]